MSFVFVVLVSWFVIIGFTGLLKTFPTLIWARFFNVLSTVILPDFEASLVCCENSTKQITSAIEQLSSLNVAHNLFVCPLTLNSGEEITCLIQNFLLFTNNVDHLPSFIILLWFIFCNLSWNLLLDFCCVWKSSLVYSEKFLRMICFQIKYSNV